MTDTLMTLAEVREIARRAANLPDAETEARLAATVERLYEALGDAIVTLGAVRGTVQMDDRLASFIDRRGAEMIALLDELEGR